MNRRELTKQRRSFEKETLRQLRIAVRGSGWRTCKNSIFREEDGMFFSAELVVFLKEAKTVFSLDAKPMSLDPIFWSIMDMRENEKEPLSLRAWGCFVCSSLPVGSREMSDDGTEPASVASAFHGWVQAESRSFLTSASGRQFSELVQEHENQKARGAYAETLIAALVSEGKLSRARDAAEDYISGRMTTCCQHCSGGRTFMERVPPWIAGHQKLGVTS